MLTLTRALIVLGLLLGGSVGSAERIANQLTAHINTMQRVQEQACASAGVCENEPIGSAIQTMLRLQQRLRTAVDDPQQGGAPEDPGNGPAANGPNADPSGPTEPEGQAAPMALNTRTVLGSRQVRVGQQVPTDLKVPRVRLTAAMTVLLATAHTVITV